MIILICLVGAALISTLSAGWNGDWANALEAVRGPAFFTVWQALLSTALSLGFAIPVALALEHLHAFKGRQLILSLFAIPLSLPAIIAVLALLALFGRSGWVSQISATMGLNWKPDIYGLSGILIAHVFFNMPLAVRMLAQRFEALSPEQFKLGESLGFNTYDRTRLILWPAMRTVLPGIASLIFLLCAGSYTIILVLGGGPATTTLQAAIYQALSFDFDLAKASLLTVVQLAMTLLFLTFLPRSPSLVGLNAHQGARRFHQLNGQTFALSTATLVLGTAFVALPLLAIIMSGISANHAKLIVDPQLWQAILTSTIIGLLSALLATMAAYALCAASYSTEQKHSTRMAGILNATPLALLGLPSLLLGVGWFLFVLKTGLPLTIAPLLIVLANTMMALPFGISIIKPRLFESFKVSDRLCANLRLKGWARLKLIDVPQMRGALATSFLFAFALSLGDLGVITLFGTDTILTLPSLILQKMGSYRTNDAAGLALYLALYTGLLTLLSTRIGRHV